MAQGKPLLNDFTLQLGLFNVRGGLVGTVVDRAQRSTAFRIVCPECANDGKAVRGDQKYICPADHRFSSAEARRAKEIGTGKTAKLELLTREQVDNLKNVDERVKNVMDLQPFPRKAVERFLVPNGVSYLFTPDARSLKAYNLLRNVVDDSDIVFCGTTWIKTGEDWCFLQVHEGNILINCCVWPEQIAVPPAPPAEEPASDREKELLGSLVETLITEFDPATIRSQAVMRHEAIMDALKSGQAIPETLVVTGDDSMVSLTAMLEASLAQAQTKGNA